MCNESAGSPTHQILPQHQLILYRFAHQLMTDVYVAGDPTECTPLSGSAQHGKSNLVGQWV